jgi:tetratricopeptide (TPR) repeat protein
MKSSEGAATQTEQDRDYAHEELLEKAWAYAREELFGKAHEAFTRALRLAPTSSEALYGQALCLRKLDKKDEAQSKLEDLRELDPGYARFLVKEALLYIDKEQYHNAIEPFVEAYDKAGEAKDNALRMIVSLRSQLPFQEVERVIEAALRYFPGDPGIRSEYGWLHYTHEQYDEAIEKFDEVLQDKKYELKANKYKDHESALQGKIASLRLQRQFQKAYDLLQDPIELLPDQLRYSKRTWLASF